MTKIGYSTQLVELVNMMIEETETRRIRLTQISDVLDEVDRMGEAVDGLSVAASERARDQSFSRSMSHTHFGNGLQKSSNLAGKNVQNIALQNKRPESVNYNQTGLEVENYLGG